VGHGIDKREGSRGGLSTFLTESFGGVLLKRKIILTEWPLLMTSSNLAGGGGETVVERSQRGQGGIVPTPQKRGKRDGVEKPLNRVENHGHTEVTGKENLPSCDLRLYFLRGAINKSDSSLGQSLQKKNRHKEDSYLPNL